MPGIGPKARAVAAAVALAACSGEEAPAGSQALEPPFEGVVGRAPPAAAGVPSAVLLHPADATVRDGAGSPGPARGVMDQVAMQFAPQLLLVRAGGSVAFTNGDGTPHMVTVRTEAGDSTVLDVSTDPGARVEHTFEAPGAYDVSCPMHPGMAAVILVHDAARAAVADADGAFRIPDVAPGSYRLEVWSTDPALRWQDTVAVGEGTTVLPDRRTGGAAPGTPG